MIEDAISGAMLLEHLGACTRWSYYFIKSELTGSRRRKYREFYDARKGWKFSQKTKKAMYNNFIGLIMLVVILRILLFISEMF